ncbi:PHA/PHB synthase family protein [Parerythrobacter jejuensis]|uniref:Class I poly(R)-hydroxyalkanoic acid synthase n=1 Tax=Parerythrobacter jejuensis TaxID=795812 RepID=A0A845AVG4_9SPHN|nr:class I poly(R)-hydroxyalkanoic acid synthase [Parerythrobacter jejuensis]MXP30413.1 class I poly(R)-hydroxyalkanoic acid synthase [Parerythrobacter jejuensis]MXP33173.1 class I poly(R)-hydroxyalkanoic acid synthase [Parerythrobacter jejuensis]
MTDPKDPTGAFSKLFELQEEASKAVFGQLMPGTPPVLPNVADAGEWAQNSAKLQAMWLKFQAEQAAKIPSQLPDPAKWMSFLDSFHKRMPMVKPEAQMQFWGDAMNLWKGVLGQFGGSGFDLSATDSATLPRSDKRFRDERWQNNPVFALIHQTYLLMAEQLEGVVESLDGVDAEKREQLQFAVKAVVDALSPSNFAATNPIVLERTIETKGANLVKGMEHMLTDMRRGQLTHTDPDAFKLGENIAVSPGKVVHETKMYQLIQYAPSTGDVLKVPLVIFPPWINRFYILDLNPKKSFIRWAVEQGLTVFVVSWKSADSSMKNVVWDDYIRSQIEAIDHIRSRLKVPDVHTIGYCVAGTTLAATLAILAKRGEQGKVMSATFFTAQVDFEKAGELLHFIDDNQIKAIEAMSGEGYLDGRYMAAAFNLLRGTDLIWNYVVNNYLLGEDYPAFDLLHWNGDVTNLPAKWHKDYLQQLYRDNLLVKPGALTADNTPIDLGEVSVPTYVQAGKEDHIAPAESVWKIRDHFTGPLKFVLAGSGHIAGVVNPPESGKYQYWLNDDPGVESLEAFREGAEEHPGSWWPDWIDWIRQQSSDTVKANGKRNPGATKADPVIEDAPGRYVAAR